MSKSALEHNLRALKALAPSWGVVPVLKSNAYGHGLVPVAAILEGAEGIPFFGVDSYFEAESLRAAGIQKPILVLGFTPSATIKGSRLQDVSFTVASLEQLRELAATDARQWLQIKFDTGMHRQGIQHDALDEVLKVLHANPDIQVKGALSHFAESEAQESKLTKLQIRRWNDIARALQRAFPNIEYYHLANSGGFAHAKDVVANAGRTGIALYGIDPGNLDVELRPALKMTSVVSELRTLEDGESVGYNATFTSRGRTRVATVPGGYFEGVDRRLSNRGAFLVSERPALIVGRVSMNISSCDVTDFPDAHVGTKVTLISDRPKDANSVEQIAVLCSTIPYEILVHIPAHLYRRVVT